MNHRLVLALVWVCVLLLVFASCSGSSPMPGASAEVDASVTTAPLDAKAQVRAAYVAARQAEGGRDAQYAVRAAPRGDGFVAVHEAMGMRAELGGNGATLSKAGETWSATLAGARYGCAGGSLAAIERTGAPRVGANPNRVEYAGRATGAAVDEWYVHGPLGLEQGFTVGQSACGGGGGDLVIEVRLEGLEAAASPGGSGLDLRDAGNVVRMRYTDLWARDASGAALVASMDAVPGWIALRVDARGAKFPVTVDPLAWLQTAELTASDGAANDRFGYSVSVSGPLAIVGATYHAVGANAHQGAAYVFVQSGTTWTQQQELTASDGAASDDFGTSVALSGTTAIVGAPDHAVGANPAQGAAYVFVQSGATWTQQQELTASDGVASDVFGSSVSLSGTMAIVGAQNHTVGASQQQGAAYIFAQSGTTWTQQQEVTASDGVASDDFGTSVSLSGTIAIVGAPYHTVGANQQQGAAYIFVQSGATWTQQQELTAGDGAGGDHFGLTGSVSGNIAIVGSFFHNRLSGAAYIFVQSGTTWTQQQELTASDGAPYAEFGFSVSLSGTTAIVGADDHTVGANPDQGAAYVFVQSGTTWTQQQEVTANDGAGIDSFGYSVALSGTTAIVGAFNHAVGANAGQGAAYIEALLPANGSTCSSGTDCGSSYCVSSVCCNTACGPCGDCSSGTCTNLAQGSAGTPACTLPYACNGSSAACPTSCTGDSDCIATDYCSGSTCVPAHANSTSCTEDRQCTSGNCSIAGICSGSSANATPCTAADQCETGYCASGVCCKSACTAGPCQACNVSGSVGTCETVPVTSPGNPSCAPYVCNGSTTACPTTCTQDAQCSTADYCSAGSCLVKHAMGTTCTADDQCSSESCASGICVGTQSNGTICAAADQCSTGNCVSGICCNTTCLGACATCVTGNCGIAAATSAGTPSCTPYVCDGTDKTCPTTCSTDAQCTTADYCSGGQCVPTLVTGASCTADDQCVSDNCASGLCSGIAEIGAACTAGDQCNTGFCVDGFCCNTACTGQCQACDVAATHGVCSQVNGDPHGQRAACAGAGTTCGATCTASRGQQACQYAASGTTCGSASCSDQELVTSACDGTGTCAPEAATPCPGNFACVGTACKTGCATTSDCASGFGCTGGACEPTGGSVCSGPHTAMNTTGGAGVGGSTDCSPYICQSGTGKCATACTSVAECVAPNVCNPSGQCVAPAASSGSSGGCMAAPGGASEGGGAVWLLGVALLTRRMRRRTPTRTAPRDRGARGNRPMNHRPLLALVWRSVLLLVFAGCSGWSRMPGASAEVDASVETASLEAKAQVRAAYVAARQAEGASDAAYAVRAAPRGDGFVAMPEAMRLRAELGANGATMSKAGEAWSATLTGARYGCAGSSLAAIERTAAPRVGATANRVEVAGRAAGAAVDEWYVHGPLGLEQGFTLGESACGGGGGGVVIEVHLEGLEAAASQGGSGLDLRDAGDVVRMRYTDLWARDASGAALVASMDAVPGWIALRVDARGAKFPVTVDPLAWLQTAELTASDGAKDDYFGNSVSISGTLAIVGAPFQTVGANPGQGAAYVFVQSGTTWTQQQELTASDGAAEEYFGRQVSILGPLAIVGADNHAVGANARQGAAYIFVQSGTTWTQQVELTSSDGAQDDYFGDSVSISGTIAIVGAREHTVGANPGQGAAYIFGQSGATWTQQQELTASDGAQGDNFGSSASISGTLAIVGAPNHTVGASADQGAAYVFVQSGATWTQQQELTASDGAQGDNLGYSVSISGTLTIVGAPDHTVGANADQGAGYIFVQSGTTWTQQQELTASDGAQGDEFGHSVSLSGTIAIVGADSQTVGANPDQGAAYVFVQSGTTWTEQQELTASDGAASDISAIPSPSRGPRPSSGRQTTRSAQTQNKALRTSRHCSLRTGARAARAPTAAAAFACRAFAAIPPAAPAATARVARARTTLKAARGRPLALFLTRATARAPPARRAAPETRTASRRTTAQGARASPPRPTVPPARRTASARAATALSRESALEARPTARRARRPTSVRRGTARAACAAPARARPVPARHATSRELWASAKRYR